MLSWVIAFCLPGFSLQCEWDMGFFTALLLTMPLSLVRLTSSREFRGREEGSGILLFQMGLLRTTELSDFPWSHSKWQSWEQN